MSKSFFQHNLALNEQEEKVLRFIRSKGVSIASVFRGGLNLYAKKTGWADENKNNIGDNEALPNDFDGVGGNISD